ILRRGTRGPADGRLASVVSRASPAPPVPNAHRDSAKFQPDRYASSRRQPLSIRQRLQNGTDRLMSVVLASLLAGTTLAFGGAVWWAGPVIAVLTFCFALACLLRIALEGRMRLLKSPLTVLGVMALALAVVQLAPLPAALSQRFSPRSHQAYTLG